MSKKPYEIAGQVYKTKNYGMFKDNRLQREHHANTLAYAGLETSLLSTGMWISEPIIVDPMGKDGKYQIVRGHNKFEIAKKHNLYIYYQIEPLKIPIHEREGGKHNKGSKWTKKNFLHSWAKEGSNPAYMQVRNFMDKTGLSMTSAVKLYSIGSHWSSQNSTVWDRIEDGSFSILDSSHAEEVGNLVIYCRELDIPLATKDPFVNAISLIVRTKVVEIKELARRLKRNRGMLQQKLIIPDYMSLLSDVYNHGFTPKVNLPTEVRNYIDRERKSRGKNLHKKNSKEDAA